ncbi:hypothetical protein GC173_12730 [bacterium]|nr:hypothetical protein [bacterium]
MNGERGVKLATPTDTLATLNLEPAVQPRRPGNVRQPACMPAPAATCFNEDLKQACERMRTAGAPAKVAITGVMRKLIVPANALIKDDRHWTRSPA